MSEEIGEPIELTLDEDTRESLIEMFVETRLMKESVYVFNDYILGGTSVDESLVHAIINEMANAALAALVEEEKLKENEMANAALAEALEEENTEK